ncbi:MAG TPA: hypothetical protein VLV16_04480 [Gemmatimonadales bacterium]|nr:hypothetical protein [Gemmatimonadales bacterium]
MTARIVRDDVLGFDAVVLENERIRVVIVPQLGGRVWELWDRERNRQWIWHRDGVPLSASSAGANYDEAWAGGWEELFPNDAPGAFEGRVLPDHGEWWTTAWSVAEAMEGSTAVVRLTADTSVRRARCSKEFRLDGDAATLSVAYRIESREREPFHFLFKQHLAVAISPACRLVVPGGQVTAVDASFGTLLPGPGPFSWPRAGAADLTRIPDRLSKVREFVYVTDFPESTCGVDDTAAGASLRMRFDRSLVPYLWLFLSYGGWRDCYTAVLEPCTNLPKDLTAAVQSGRSARLAPGAAFETSVTVSLTSLGVP